MRRIATSLVGAVLLNTPFVSIGYAVELMRWERLPLPIPLVVGHERVILIDRNVRVGVPTSLGSRLRVQSAAGAVYLRANAPIDPARLQLQDADTGEVILLDIFATPGEEGPEPVRIVTVDRLALRSESDDTAGHPREKAARARETPIAVMLTRYAAQSLYAPLRTIEPINGITRVNVRRSLALQTLLPVLPVRAKLLAAWRLENQYVTAVRLTNTSPTLLDLDPRGLQGDFVAATFQHSELGPAGHPSDTTVVYVVTRNKGLAEALLPALGIADVPKDRRGASDAQ